MTSTHPSEGYIEHRIGSTSMCIQIQRAGNCVLRCISEHLYSNQEHHLKIRQQVVKHKRNNKNNTLS